MSGEQQELIEKTKSEKKPKKRSLVWDWPTCFITAGAVTLFFVSLITSIGATYYYSTTVDLNGCQEGETATEYRTDKGDKWKTCQKQKRRR